MQPFISNTNFYMFIISSLLSWFLKLIYLFQIEFFFICIEFFFKEKFFKVYFYYSKICFIFLYILYIIYYSIFICFFQIFFIFFIFNLKKTPYKIFSKLKNKGMLFTTFNTITLYNPVLLIKSIDNSLIFIQIFSKVLFFLFFFYCLNFII
jgi:hypothetical protein